MIKTQIIIENNKPKAVILDYKEFIRLKEMAGDKTDYQEAIEAEKNSKKLHSHETVKNRINGIIAKSKK